MKNSNSWTKVLTLLYIDVRAVSSIPMNKHSRKRQLLRDHEHLNVFWERCSRFRGGHIGTRTCWGRAAVLYTPLWSTPSTQNYGHHSNSQDSAANTAANDDPNRGVLPCLLFRSIVHKRWRACRGRQRVFGCRCYRWPGGRMKDIWSWWRSIQNWCRSTWRWCWTERSFNLTSTWYLFEVRIVVRKIFSRIIHTCRIMIILIGLRDSESESESEKGT